MQWIGYTRIFCDRSVIKIDLIGAWEECYIFNQRTRANGEPLGQALRSIPELARVLTEDDLRMIDEADSYLGMAETFRQRLLASVDVE